MNQKINPPYIEISGACNAACFFCPGGPTSSQRHAQYMDTSLLHKILTKLKKEKLISDHYCPYNYGEPFLHPDLQEVFKISRKAGLKLSISTNMIKMPLLTDDMFNDIRVLMVSISGFSNETYKINHLGGDINKVIENITEFKNRAVSLGLDIPISIRWHKYNYNEHEEADAEKYFRELGVNFFPYYAFFGGAKEIDAYFNNKDKLPFIDEIKERINLEFMEMGVNAHRKSSLCLLHDTMTIDEFGRLLVCCAIYHNDQSNVIGDYLDLSVDELMKRKRGWKFCDSCIDNGYAGFLNSPKTKDFYHRLNSPS